MKIRTVKNIFDEPGDAVCVTTNGVIKTNGEAVMGAGIAKEANMRYQVAAQLGKKLKINGNHCYDLGSYDGKNLVSFPTKHDWRNDSDIELIRQSCKELVILTDQNSWHTVLLPPVGCGCGKLDFNYIKSFLENLLDDRFILCLR